MRVPFYQAYAFFVRRKEWYNMKNSKTLTLVEGAVMVALATVLSFIRVYKLPWGGSIILLSMLPIAVFSIKHGVAKGLGAAFVFSLIQFIQGITDGLFGWGLSPVMLVACIFIDYLAAYTVLGVAGMFRKKGAVGWIAGTMIAVFLRFHFLFVSLPYLKKFSAKIQIFCGKAKPELVKVWALL